MSVRCTPFCRPCDKSYKHHELLLTLLNTRDSETIWPGVSEDHELLKSLINKHKANGWDINTEIMEENVEFRFPLLHWACVLGKIRTVRWLLDQGFSPTVQTKETLETCVHRALITLPDITATKSGRWSMHRFETILPYFRECLGMGNHRQDTPLHIAGHYIIQNKNHTLYENILLLMLNEVKKMPLNEQRKCLNAQNGSGDTVLNLLASGCKSVAVIEKLMADGADTMLVNKLNIGPLDNAERHGLVHVANALKGSFLRGCGVLQNNIVLNEDAKKRRSERRSTHYSTMASLSLLCRGDDEGDLEKSSIGSQRLTSPSKGSEKSSKSNETDELDDVVVESIFLHDETEDDETSSQSSSIVNGLGDQRQTTPSERPTNEDGVKHDDGDVDICTCCGDENKNTIATNNNPEPAKTVSEEVRLLDVMKEAGVLPNLNDVITRTKNEHVKRIQVLSESITKFEQTHMEVLNQERILRRSIEQKRRETEKLKNELRAVRHRKTNAGNKRKLMEEECGELRKKLASCETLLKTVPKDGRA